MYTRKAHETREAPKRGQAMTNRKPVRGSSIMTGLGLAVKRCRWAGIISELARVRMRWLRRGARRSDAWQWCRTSTPSHAIVARSWSALALGVAPGCRSFVDGGGPSGSRRRARPHGGDDRGPREAREY